MHLVAIPSAATILLKFFLFNFISFVLLPTSRAFVAVMFYFLSASWLLPQHHCWLSLPIPVQDSPFSLFPLGILAVASASSLAVAADLYPEFPFPFSFLFIS